MTPVPSDPLEIVVDCDIAENVWPVILHINNNLLPMDVKRSFAALILVWMAKRHSDEELFQLVRGKTVGELIRLYGSSTMPTPTHSGQKGGLKWQVFAPPGGGDHG